MLDKNIQPLGDRVVIEKPEGGETKSSTGKILLQESIGRGKVVWGKVIAVGVGIYTQTGKRIPMSVKVGDEVLYKHDMAGDSTTIDGIDYLVFREHDLIMIKQHKKNRPTGPQIG